MNRARPDLWGRRLGNRRRYPDTQFRVLGLEGTGNWSNPDFS